MNNRLLSKTQFRKLLCKRRLENVYALEYIEKYLLKERKDIFRMPRPGTAVISLVSGGLDSIVTWGMLMETYKLRVYPVHIKTYSRRYKHEQKALYWYSQYYKQRYPKLYQKPFELTYPSSFPEIADIWRGNPLSTYPKQVIKRFHNKKIGITEIKRNILFPAYIPLPVAQAATAINLHFNTNIRSLFLGTLPSDGTYNRSQTLTAIRATNFALCLYTGDFSWQLSSLHFEKETTTFRSKADLVTWAWNHNIPLDHTYSCFRGGVHNCGNCLSCSVRKQAFIQAQVRDDTKYKQPFGLRGKDVYRKFGYYTLLALEKIANIIGIHISVPRVVIKDYF